MTTKKSDIYFKINVSYFFERRWRLVFLWVVFGVLDLIPRLPYLGLIFTFQIKITVFWIITMLVLKLQPKSNFFFGIVCILFAIINIFRGKTMMAEAIGVIAYYIFFIGFLQYFLSYLKEEKNETKH